MRTQASIISKKTAQKNWHQDTAEIMAHSTQPTGITHDPASLAPDIHVKIDAQTPERLYSRREICSAQFISHTVHDIWRQAHDFLFIFSRHLRDAFRSDDENKAIRIQEQQQAKAVANAQQHPQRHSRTMPIIRPPGALAPADFLKACTSCMDCASACPHQAIVAAPIQYRQLAGTPHIQALDNPCLMCHDMPCISACEPQALRMPARAENTDTHTDISTRAQHADSANNSQYSHFPTIGSARILENSCLAYRSLSCTVCAERCPLEDAITFTHGKPQVHAEVCTGCGICAHACPAPIPAIVIIPYDHAHSSPHSPT